MSGKFLTNEEIRSMRLWRSDDPYFVTHIKRTNEGMTYYWVKLFKWLDVETGEEYLDSFYEDLSDNLPEFLHRWINIHGVDDMALNILEKIKKERENEKDY